MCMGVVVLNIILVYARLAWSPILVKQVRKLVIQSHTPLFVYGV